MQLAHTGDPDSRTDISQATLDGYAEGGELYRFVELPKFGPQELYHLRDTDYATVFYEVTKKFLHDVVPDEELRRIANESYSSELFDLDDGHLKLRELNLHDNLPSQLYVAGLSDGPTGAFKDMAMQPFARLVEAIRRHKGIAEPLDLLISTSGDTGPAAQHAFGAVGGVRTFTMYPAANGVSSVQRAQMVSMHNGETVHSLGVDGAGFSDINDIHMELAEEFDVGAVNSVNIARLVAQVAYHAATYLEVARKNPQGFAFGDPIDVAIPTGNFGNALAAIYAREMGVPIRKIILATDENDALMQYFEHGIYPKQQGKPTTSSAQAIGNASNWWRFADAVYGGRNDEIWKQWNDDGYVDFTQGYRNVRPEYTKNIKAYMIDEMARHAMMWTVWKETAGETIVDPHTANAVGAAQRYRSYWKHDVPMVAYETAKPFKFPELMKDVVGVTLPLPERLGHFADDSKKKLPHFKDADGIREYLQEHGVRQKSV